MRFPVKELKMFLPGLMAAAIVIVSVGVLIFISLDNDEAPKAVIEIPSDNIKANVPVTIDGSGSTDPDGPDEDLKFSWRIIDTFETSQPSFEFSFTKPGNYTIVLTITDKTGLSDTESVFIEVKE